VPECPAEAIVADSEPAATATWLELNREYSAKWPNIVAKKPPLADADAQNGLPGKLEHFSPHPAKEEAET
jgi:ferredoxin